MRFLGIDYGKKRIGVAISDEAGTLAFPHSIIQNGQNKSKNKGKNDGQISKNQSLSPTEQIVSICNENDIQTVVIGDSKDFKMVDNKIMPEVRAFSNELASKGLKMIFEPEVMTTIQAERIQGRRDDIDSSAAAIILQSYLDRLK